MEKGNVTLVAMEKKAWQEKREVEVIHVPDQKKQRCRDAETRRSQIPRS